jgi:hypothetical protein
MLTYAVQPIAQELFHILPIVFSTLAKIFSKTLSFAENTANGYAHKMS